MANTANRRREPKGIPTGGRFAGEGGGRVDASDLMPDALTALVEDLGDGTVRVSHPGDRTLAFGPGARREGLDRAYAAAVSSPFRLGGAVGVNRSGSAIVAYYMRDGVSVSVDVDPERPDDSMEGLVRLVDACSAVKSAGRDVARVDASAGSLIVTRADRSQLSVQPSAGSAALFDAQGDRVLSGTLNPQPAGVAKRPGDDFALDSFAAGLPGSFYDAVNAANALAGGHRRGDPNRPAHAAPTGRPKGFSASADGNAVGSRTTRVRVRRARMSTASDDDLNAAAASAARLGMPADVVGSQVTVRTPDGRFVRADRGAGYAAVWCVGKDGRAAGLSEYDMEDTDAYLDALPADRRDRFRALVSDAHRLTF